ncbi:MAG: signal peptide peptidase SppA [Gammaproteobacteria bacterium]|nr:signal peptide peptidase SppA [Gammaproteobacteria bacterium]MDE2346525.1 signal peptide peptidase SppA [Gammaproteobacteria bacterium]
MSDKNFIVQIFGGTWRLWDFLCRLVINLLITVTVIFILVGIISSHQLQVPSRAALVVDPQGDLVEQYSGDPAQRAINKLLGQKQRQQTRLRDVVAAIERAKNDSRIKALVLETDDLQGGGFLGGAALSDLQDIGQAIQDFKKTGKPVFALGDAYSQSQYYLAAMANTVFIHPQGMVFLHGYGIYQPYFKQALDKLGVEVNIFRVGKYKSAVEPFMLNGMSPDAREDWGQVVGVLWNAYQHDVTAARKLKPNALNNYIDNSATELAAVGGDTARLALNSGLVDKIATEDQMENAVIKVVGESNHSFRQIDFLDYLRATNDDRLHPVSGNAVGIIVASGDIVPGDQPSGTIGGDSTSDLIRKARYDNSIKAVVLRVDSPGGSAFASDLILRQIELTKQAGKPVIVSMGSVAASGGYWISMAGDQIYANPTTLTGSIGIFGMFPTFQKTLAKLGIHTDGVGTTPLSNAFDVTQPMSPTVQKIMQLDIDNGYQEFITKVAHNRHLSVADVNNIGQGRVWSGLEAKKLGLIDKFGNLQDAVAEAAKLAKLGPHYAVRYIEPPLSLTDRLIIAMANSTSSLRLNPAAGLQPAGVFSGTPWYAQMQRMTEVLKVFTDPRGIYAYCFCNIH